MGRPAPRTLLGELKNLRLLITHTGTKVYSWPSAFLQSAWPPRGPGKQQAAHPSRNLLRYPPGAGGISKQISAWMSSVLLPWTAGRPSRLQERTWLRIYFGASVNSPPCAPPPENWVRLQSPELLRGSLDAESSTFMVVGGFPSPLEPKHGADNKKTYKFFFSFLKFFNFCSCFCFSFSGPFWDSYGLGTP